MKAIVTGGAGFIGSTLVDRLLNEGHDVSIVDDFSTGKEANIADARARHEGSLSIHHVDIRDPKTVEVVEGIGGEVIVHLAAQMDVRVSVADPVFDASINIIGGLNVLEGARRGGTRKVLFASSGGTIYGLTDESLMPFDESVPQRPISPYAISKKAFADYLFAYNELYGIDYAALALGNVFGPRQDPHGEAGVVAIFGQRLLAGEPCKIFGDGQAIRDYVYVDDVVDAFIRAFDKGTGLFNVGTGVPTSTRQVYDALAKAAGVDAEPEYAPARPGELQRVELNTSKARTELGWEPKTDLAGGAEKVLDFIRQQQSAL